MGQERKPSNFPPTFLKALPDLFSIQDMQAQGERLSGLGIQKLYSWCKGKGRRHVGELAF